MSAPAQPEPGVEDKLLVACPSCHNLVRVPRRRLADGPHCGRCKAEVLSGATFALDSASFHTHVERGSLPVLVDFWAPWCGPCKMISPAVEELGREFAGRLRVAKVNTDDNPDWAGRLGIMGIPTLIFFKRGREVDRVVGAASKASLRGHIERLLSQN